MLGAALWITTEEIVAVTVPAFGQGHLKACLVGEDELRVVSKALRMEKI